MSPTLPWSALLASLVLLCLASLSASYTYSPLSTGSCIPNYGLRWVNGSSNATVLPSRLVYPACAYNNHLRPTDPSAAAGAVMFAHGGYPAYKGPVQSTLFVSQSGFQSLLYSPPANVSSTVGTNWGGLAAITANGTFIIFGGRVGTSASTTSPVTHVSYDKGQSWTVSGTNNTGPAKYETPMLAIPQTNWLVIVGGYSVTGAQTNQVWLSQDGLGANWTLQTSTPTLATTSLGAAVALSDSSFCNPLLFSTPNSTLVFFLEFDDGYYYFSYDLGHTWSAPFEYPFATSVNDDTHRDWITAAADTDSNIYFAGGYTLTDPRIWISVTKGQTWAPLTQAAGFAGKATSLQFQYTLYNCMGLTYNPRTLNKQLVMYAYETFFSDGSSYEAVTADLSVPNGQVGWGPLPNASITDSAPYTAVSPTLWPACAYNVHSLTSGSPVLFAGGGLSLGSGTSISTTYVRSSASALSSAGSGGALPAAVYNAGSVVLPNGNILVIGGQQGSSAASTLSSTVYLSADSGQSWSTSTTSAAFGALTQFATCVQPATSSVLVIGGNSSTGASTAVWLNTDGTGASWTSIGSLPAPVIQGAAVFLYDGSAFTGSSSGGNANATLLVFTHQMRLYRSTTLGATFQSHPSVVFPGNLGYQLTPLPTQNDNTATRYGLRVVVDYDNFLYLVGGSAVSDANVWFSGDLGYTFYALKQSPASASLGTYLQGSTACLGLYYNGGASPSAVKTLVLYGGQGITLSNSNNYSAVAIALDAAPAYLPTVAGSSTAPNTTLLAARYNAAQVSCPFPASTPAVQWTAFSSAAPSYQFPLCGRDIHHLNATTGVTPRYYLYGGRTSPTNVSTTQRLFSASADGFNTVSANHTDATLGALSQGYMAVMPSGTILVMGGVTGANTSSSNVYSSVDGGQTFTLTSSSFPALILGQLVVVPYTSTLLLVGGFNLSAGAASNAIYISTDGAAAVWTLQSAATANVLPPSTQAVALALYDSAVANPSLYSAPNPTVLFFTAVPVSTTSALTSVYRSVDLGGSWSAPQTVPFSSEFVIAVSSATAAPSGALQTRAYMNIVADLQSYVYSWGYSNAFNLESDPTVWLSTDKANTFAILQLNPSAWSGKSAALEAYAWQYGCSALQYSASTTTSSSSTQQRTPQLVNYGGAEYVSDGTLVTMTQAAVLNLNATGVDAALPQLTLLSGLSSITAGLTTVNLSSPTCAFNVHARNGVMLAVAVTADGRNATFTASSASFSTAASITSYVLPSPVPALSGGALALLNNGALLLFGGLSTTGSTSASTYSNAVYSTSTSSGIAFSLVGAAPWSPRSALISCVQPFSNAVLMFGGVGAGAVGGAAAELSDGWVSQDGVGASWTQLPQAAMPWGSTGLHSGSCAFLYDSSLVVGRAFTGASSTLLLFTERGLYYRSTTLGQTWVQQPSAYTPNAPPYQVGPWSTQADASGQRLNLRVVADFDNVVYAAAGSGVQDGTVWMSSDSAMTWYRLAQRNAVSAQASAQLFLASSSCLALNYRTATAGSGNTFNKTLVLYGGQIALSDGTQLQALSVSSSQPPVFTPNATAAQFNATSARGPGSAGSASGSPGISSSSSASGAGGGVGSFSSGAGRSSSSSAGSFSSSISSSAGGAGTSSFISSSSSSTGPAAAASVLSSSSSSSGTSGSVTGGGGGGSSSSLSGGAIAGIVIGSVVGGALLVCALLYACLALSRKQKDDGPQRINSTESSRSTAPGLPPAHPDGELETSQVEMQ